MEYFLQKKVEENGFLADLLVLAPAKYINGHYSGMLPSPQAWPFAQEPHYVSLQALSTYAV
jgi:hypothetical protein